MQDFGRMISTLRVAAVVVPIGVGGLLLLANGVVSSPAAALILVLAVVGAAATGDRTTGVLAALSGAVAFDFFLTAPYLDLHIANAEDIELAVLLLLVGLAVNELALWGRRQHASASERAGFMYGVLEAADLSARGISVSETVDAVSGHIRRTVGAEEVAYESGAPSLDCPVVQRDGSVTFRGVPLNVIAHGLPADRYTAVPVIQGERTVGHFLMSSANRNVRPRSEQLRVAVLLADQVARRRMGPVAVRSIDEGRMSM